MATPFTPQQRQAIDDPGSVVLAAGAGSGKTRVLVERYLRLLQSHSPSQLVAITFTDRAAREMRRRIRVGLRERRKQHPDEPRWAAAEANLESAVIDTIHGFGTRLLRKHGAALGIPPNFQVQDALVTATIRDDVLETELYTILLGQGPLTRDLHELVVLYGWQAVASAVTAMLAAPEPEAWATFAGQSPRRIAEDWVRFATTDLHGRYRQFLFNKYPVVQALHALVPVTAEGLSHLTAIRQQMALLQTQPTQVDLEAFQEQLSLKLHAKLKKQYGTENYSLLQKAFPALREGVCQPLQDFGIVPSPETLETAALAGQRLARLALAVKAAYATRKHQAAVLDFQDLLTLSRNLLRDHVAIRKQVQKQYKALLLDELQDTDPVQMDLVNLVLGEAKWTGGLFAVGDAKQSIYRFRGAEVKLFEALRHQAPPAARQELTVNFRSRPGILEFVNALCRAWFPGESELVPHREAVPEPAVECLWTLPPQEKLSAAELRRLDAEAISQRILSLTSGPTPTCQRHEIVLLFRALSDVAIYEDALRDAGIDYYLVGGRAFFAQQEVHDLFHLFSALENPYDSLALAGVLRSPFCGLSDDALHAVAFGAESIWDGLHDHTRRGALTADEAESIARAVRHLTSWRSLKDCRPLARLLQRILDDSGYDAALLFEPLGERKLANLWKLQEIARQFDAAGASLAEFVLRLRDLVSDQPREEQAATLPEEAQHVVKIMSIHQAKGLEFPVVFLPDLDRGENNRQEGVLHWHRDLGAVLPRSPSDMTENEKAADNPFSIWPSKLGQTCDQLSDAQESRRVFYVASTRAEERLILTAAFKKNEVPVAPHGPTLTELAHVFDLTTGASLIPGGPKLVVSLHRPPSR